MSTLTDEQVADAALYVVDDYLDNDIEFLTVTENADEFFEDGWSGDNEDGEPIEVDIELDSEDYARISEEANNIMRHLRGKVEGYYDD